MDKEKAIALEFSPNCLSIDLEVGKSDGRIHAFAGIHGKTGEACVREKREVLDRKNNVVGRLARNFSPPEGMKCIAARVGAIYVRRREDEGSEFQDRVRCDQWEVVLPELVYEPESLF